MFLNDREVFQRQKDGKKGPARQQNGNPPFCWCTEYDKCGTDKPIIKEKEVTLEEHIFEYSKASGSRRQSQYILNCFKFAGMYAAWGLISHAAMQRRSLVCTSYDMTS